MRAYVAMIKARFRMLLQYRAAALAGFTTQLFWGGIRVMIFEAFYRSTTAPQPLTYSQTVTYLWLIQAMLLIIPWGIDPELRRLILGGNVAYELVRPVDLYWLWYSRAIAGRTAPVLLRATPMFIVAGLFFGMQLPASPASAAVWALSMAGALALSCALNTLMAVTLIWTITGDGIVRLLATVTMILSGSIIPLPFFPDWAQRILNLLPFRGLIDVPFRIYMGDITPLKGLELLGHQFGWSAALILFGRWLLGRGMRRMVVQGG
jgi:ABC-2 type transport system permease protein